MIASKTLYVMLACVAETTRYLAVYVLQVIGHMMTCSIPAMIVTVLATSLLPITLTYSLLDDTSHLLSCLSTINEDVHISKGYPILEVKSL